MAFVKTISTMRTSNNSSGNPRQIGNHNHKQELQHHENSNQQQQQQHHHRGFKALLSRSNVRSQPQQQHQTTTTSTGGGATSGAISSSYAAHPQLHSSTQQVVDDFLPNPKIPDSPTSGSTPPRKKWEGAYRNFLSRGSKSGSPNTVSSDISSKSPESSSERKQHHHQQKGGGNGGGGGGFSLLPGTKRLVTRTSVGSSSNLNHNTNGATQHPPPPTTPQSVPDTHRSVMQPFDLSTRSIPSLPNLRAAELKHQHKHKQQQPQNTNANTSSSDETAVRGGKFFKSVFSRARSGSNVSTSPGTKSLAATTSAAADDELDMRRSKSCNGDELDACLRRGEEKGTRSPSSTSVLIDHNRIMHSRGTSTGTFASLGETTIEEDSGGLDSLLASADTASSPNLAGYSVGNGGMTGYSSTGNLMLHHPMNQQPHPQLPNMAPQQPQQHPNNNLHPHHHLYHPQSFALQPRRAASTSDIDPSDILNDMNNIGGGAATHAVNQLHVLPNAHQVVQQQPMGHIMTAPQTFRSAHPPQQQQQQEQQQQRSGLGHLMAQQQQQQPQQYSHQSSGLGHLMAQQQQQAYSQQQEYGGGGGGGLGALLAQQASNYDDLDVRHHHRHQTHHHQQLQRARNSSNSLDLGDSSIDTPTSLRPIAEGGSLALPPPPSMQPPTSLDIMLQNPSFAVGASPSSMHHHHHLHHYQQQQQHQNPALKKAFTEFHNASKFNADASSAFLGDESSLSMRHDSYVSYQMMMMRGGGSSVPYHETMSERNVMEQRNVSTSLPLETVDEHSISIHKSMRLLKPMQGTDSWEQGRRYLIAPAAMAACPLTVVDKLSGELTQTAVEASSSLSTFGFGTIDLGECLITYVGEKHHLSLGKWSSCRLVLRQNYLLEYDCSAPKTSLPRGFCHLQHAVATRHSDFQDSFELTFYASPCARADQRVLMVRVLNRDERDAWIDCLNRAARLEMTDLWHFDPQLEVGRGRYASVYPARRKTASDNNGQESRYPTFDECTCALKVVDKNQFWRRVVKGRERSDTLVREPSVQSTLTAKCGKVPTFLQLRGFFETSDNVVMELELLKGLDLFDHISENGVLSEKEAAEILSDILTSLEAMNRVGLAHRDVKPANILMCDKEKDGVSIKLGDFGMSTFVGVDGLVRGRCGTPGYVAPEILTTGSRVGYGNRVDVFSAGVTLYVMLCGYEPFYGETEKELIEANKAAKIDFSENEWNSVSKEARDLVLKMTAPDPGERFSAKDALEHPWIKGHVGSDAASENAKNDSGPISVHSKNIALSTADAPGEGACVIS